jgi:hypothetical protein
MGVGSPVCQKIEKLLFKISKKKTQNKILHVHITLTFSRASFLEKIQLYIAYTEITNCPINTTLIAFVLFIEIQIYIFSFLCRQHMVVFCLENLHKYI